MNKDKRIQAPHVFAARVAAANAESRSHRECRRLAENGKRQAGMAHTHQPKRDEPGYVYRGPPMRPDFRVTRAAEWGHEADADHRLRRGLPG